MPKFDGHIRGEVEIPSLLGLGIAALDPHAQSVGPPRVKVFLLLF